MNELNIKHNINGLKVLNGNSHSKYYISTAAIAHTVGRLPQNVDNEVELRHLSFKKGSYKTYTGDTATTYLLDKENALSLVSEWKDSIKGLIIPKINKLQDVVSLVSVKPNVEVQESKSTEVSPALLSGTETMSSLEIAELTGKTHKNILRDLKVMLTELKDGSDLIHEEYQILRDGRGYVKEILLNKDLSLTLVSGYNVSMRHKIIKRWQHLENNQSVPTKSDDEKLLDSMTYLIKKVEADKPKVAFYDAIAKSDDHMTIAELASKLGVGRNKLYHQMRVDGILGGHYKSRVAHNIPYQKYIDQGYFKVVTKLSLDDEIRSVPAVTAKGMQWLYEKYCYKTTEINTID